MNDLPIFKSPPVTEMVLGVQFNDVPEFNPIRLGGWWQTVKNDFPNLQQHERLPKRIVPKDLNQPAKLTLTLSNRPQNLRCWFLNESGTQLIQIQDDRFIYNWRKQNDTDGYPRYENIKARFKELFLSFCAYSQKNKFGEIIPNACEVVYVNRISQNELWKSHSDISKVIGVDVSCSDSFLPRPELINAGLSYRLENNGDFVGRSTVNINSAYDRKTREPIIHLQFECIGEPVTKDFVGMEKFMDIGHEWIVKGFASLTTEAMHKVWGRDNG